MNDKVFTFLATAVTVLILLSLILCLTGCTTYDIIRQADGSTEVHVRSWRNFEDVALEYTKNGEIVGFKFGAASGISQTPIDAALKGIEMGISIATGRSASDNQE